MKFTLANDEARKAENMIAAHPTSPKLASGSSS